MTQTEKRFQTIDLYLASFLFFSGIEPDLEISNRKVVFNFPATDDLYRLMGEFNANVAVPVGDMTLAIKILKGKMLSKRENITGSGNGGHHASRYSG